MTSYYQAYIGLGSNLNGPTKQLMQALNRLQRLPQTRLTSVSPFYRNPAITEPDSPAQPDFVNAVAGLETHLAAPALLRFLQGIEQQQGRQRPYRWAPRTLDLDLLVYGSLRLKLADLVLPHPELWQRPFVLYPLHDIAPYLSIPGFGCVKKLLRSCPKNQLKRLEA